MIGVAELEMKELTYVRLDAAGLEVDVLRLENIGPMEVGTPEVAANGLVDMLVDEDPEVVIATAEVDAELEALKLSTNCVVVVLEAKLGLELAEVNAAVVLTMLVLLDMLAVVLVKLLEGSMLAELELVAEAEVAELTVELTIEVEEAEVVATKLDVD